MAKTKDLSVEQKLRTLYDLQLIYSKMDDLNNIKGELPMEVQDLEDELDGLNTRIGKLEGDIEEMNNEILAKKAGIKESEMLIKRYTEQLDNVKNNREYEALSKEIELQNLEIQLFEKKIKTAGTEIEAKNQLITDTKETIESRKDQLNSKKKELDDVLGETNKQEEYLTKEITKIEKQIDEKLLKSFYRIRNRIKNGLAIVPIDRGASGGSFVQIPIQKQLEIGHRKKIILDDHSGRILVDADLAYEEKEKMEKLFVKSKG